MNTVCLLSIGELLWDCLPSGKRCGGAPGNLVFHARNQGIDARLASAVGGDPDGDELLEWIRRRGLGDEFIARNSHPTGLVSVTLVQGIPHYEIHAPAAWDFIPVTESALAFARNAAAVCFGSLAQRGETSRTGMQQIVAAAPESSLRVFDVNLRQNFYFPALLRESLTLANVLKISDEELPVLRDIFGLPGDDGKALAELLRRFRLHFLLFTLGKKGSLFLNAEQAIHQEIIDCGPVADTVGCGDSFLASFLAAYLQGAAPERALRHASAVSGLVAAREGAMPNDDDFRRAASASLAEALC